MATNVELDKALEIVKKDALEKAHYFRKLLSEKPMDGWSQEQHDKYCTEQLERALLVDKWCFARMMQIDPD